MLFSYCVINLHLNLYLAYNGGMDINQLKQGDNIRVYANGAVFDNDKGRIVAMRPELAVKNTQITPKSSGELLAIRLQGKRDTIAAAALAAVQSSSLVKAHGSAAWIAEIAQAQMAIATTPDAGVASTKAADWLVNNTGLSERQAVDGGSSGGVVAGVAALVAELAAFASSIGTLARDGAVSVRLSDIISNDDDNTGGSTGDNDISDE